MVAAAMRNILEIDGLCKTYASGLQALKPIHLSIREGEIFALLGPNGAGKTTLIGLVCGLLRASGGTVRVGGFDHASDYRQARALIGLVPQELATEMFETPMAAMRFTRGLFAKPPNQRLIEELLRGLSLWDKRSDRIQTLSGGMKRRVMIAKALAHEPRLLFLDEPTAGVDVELRRDMWALVRGLRERGVTIVLTTHYIEEAEEMADRIGVINKGELVLVDDKSALMRKLGSKRLTLHLQQPLPELPTELAAWSLNLIDQGNAFEYVFDINAGNNRIPELLNRINSLGIGIRDLSTEQSSLEDIFVSLTRREAA